MQQNPHQLLKMLVAGHLDALVEWKVLGEGNIKALGLESQVEALPKPLMAKSLYPFLHKKHQQLIPQLTQAIRKTKQDGSYDRLKQEVLKNH